MAKRDIENLPTKIPFVDNLTAQEKRASFRLKNNSDFIIREADKGGNIVLWPHDLYTKEAYRQLENPRFYRKLPSDPTGIYSTKLRTLIDRALELGIINIGERDFIWVKHPTTSTFYMLPKVHKDVHRPPGRPIVSSIGSLCEKACTYVDFFLQPLVLNLPSYTRDSSDFIASLQDITLAPGEIMVTCDVESLYSNIDHDHGLQAVLFFLDQQQNSDRLHDSFIVDLLDFILRHNFFLFDRNFFLQVSGVAMGARCAPALANLFLGWWESTVVYKSVLFSSKVRCWRRYIDDVFFIWTGSQDEVETFIGFLNDNPYNIFLTSSCSSSSVIFLDLNVVCQDGVLSTCLYRKPTATNNLLEFRSFHPSHTKKGIPVGQFLRTRRNCTRDEDFYREAHDLTQRFKKRTYPNKYISQAYQRAKGQSQVALLQPREKTSDRSVRFITGFNTHWSQVRHILQRHWGILTTDLSTSQIVSERPLITARRAPNLRDILTRSHYARPTVKLNRGISLKGSFPCGDCNVCQFIHPVRDNFCNPTDQKEHRLKSYINCRTTNVIYAITCPCPLVYVGQTSQELRRRIQKHLSTISMAAADSRKDKTLTTVAAHFLRHHAGKYSGTKVVGLERIRGSDRGGPLESRLLQAEARWIFLLHSTAPSGINEDLLFTGFLG
ncbi:unnamed protein product [Ranitomeya imitator]|uniref:Helix-turn-helix domain-containing protein n=1 Tax=Ranitomeya imitator TaxID=111125 RepID=A0ABN9LGK7_9NEOB|nr:unnamed protein product [Ranitomeya imitator]